MGAAHPSAVDRLAAQLRPGVLQVVVALSSSGQYEVRGRMLIGFVRSANPPGVRWLPSPPPIVGVGVETVGTDAGAAHSFDPAFPCHYYVLGAGKYGLTQLANLSQLPPSGAVVVVAPLKIVGGSGSPCRVLAFVPRP